MNASIINRKIMHKLDGYHRKFDNIINRVVLWINGVEFDRSVLVSGRIFIRNEGKIRIGVGTRINSASWTNPIGGNDRTYLQIMRGGVLSIGDNSGISNTAITVAESVNIGRNVFIGAGCKIYDTDFHPIEAEFRFGDTADITRTKTKRIIIEDGAFIGGHSIILKGTHIGENSVIGAGSVVAGNIPANEIWAGNPARFIKKIKGVMYW